VKAKAVIFDMDGLLVDSETVWFVAESALIEARGHKYTEEVREQIIGMRMDEFMTKLHAVYGLKEPVADLSTELVDRLLELLPTEVKAQPGAYEIVDFVVARNIPRAIASSSPISVIDATMEAHNWLGAFPVRCTADDEENGKPAPDVYLTAARRLGIDPAECIALEDSPNGARAAVAAGMTCYVVPDLSHSSPDVFDGITPHVFGDLHEVLDVLRSNHHV
jgi:HAD superfamily hydrolase (TIGR01509 family)